MGTGRGNSGFLFCLTWEKIIVSWFDEDDSVKKEKLMQERGELLV